MRVFRGLQQAAPMSTALTLGNFDGVHQGHQALLSQLIARAQALELSATVLTFEPHPREFFSPATAPARLTPLREKLEYLAAAGVAQTFVLHFNAALAALNAEDFIAQALLARLKTCYLMIGDDFHFGLDRRGDFTALASAGKRYGFGVEAMSTVFFAGERISSSAIRQALRTGAMDKAASLLGRPYAIDGRVAPGRRLGRQLGFATANLYIRHAPLPMTGVFAVQVAGVPGAGDRVFPGVANLGIRPTLADGGNRPLLETHLFDFHGDLYGAHLSIRFAHKLREEMKFADLSALQAQIARDVEAAQAFFFNAK